MLVIQSFHAATRLCLPLIDMLVVGTDGSVWYTKGAVILRSRNQLQVCSSARTLLLLDQTFQTLRYGGCDAAENAGGTDFD